MKNLDLNACGVSEMNATEMKTVEGGWYWWLSNFAEFCTNGISWGIYPTGQVY